MYYIGKGIEWVKISPIGYLIFLDEFWYQDYEKHNLSVCCPFFRPQILKKIGPSSWISLKLFAVSHIELILDQDWIFRYNHKQLRKHKKGLEFSMNLIVEVFK